MKTNKSFTKRLRVTRTGKIIARKPGQDHFNAKKSRAERMNKRRTTHLVMTNKERGRFLSNQ